MRSPRAPNRLPSESSRPAISNDSASTPATATSIPLVSIKSACLRQTLKTSSTGAVQRFRLSARAYHRVLKVARTIADLEGTEQITAAHISEALLFRQMDLSSGPSPKGEGKDPRI
jgi:predicted ATPase with chaperone activity